MSQFHPLFKKLAASYRTPRQVQRFIQSLEYNDEKDGKSLRSALGAINNGRAHCLEATFVAAAILEVHGYPTLALDLESKDGLDHVVFVFKDNNRWGAIGRSREGDLEGRAPQFRSVRDLAWSYFDPYVDKTGRLKAYQLVNLDDTEANWRTSSRNVWKAEDYLISIPHRKLTSSNSRYRKLLNKHLRGEKLQSLPHWW
jgi:hypothetical protein